MQFGTKCDTKLNETARDIPPVAYVACPAGSVDRHTDTSESITFPHPSNAGGNENLGSLI